MTSKDNERQYLEGGGWRVPICGNALTGEITWGYYPPEAKGRPPVKTNVQDNRDREDNATIKTDADEVSGSSDCSAVFGPGIKYVLGPEIRLKPGCDIKERDGYKYIRGEDADIVWGPTSKIYPVNNWNEPARVTFVDGVWTVID